MTYHYAAGQLVVIAGHERSLVCRVNTLGDWLLGREVDGSLYANERDMMPAEYRKANVGRNRNVRVGDGTRKVKS